MLFGRLQPDPYEPLIVPFCRTAAPDTDRFSFGPGSPMPAVANWMFFVGTLGFNYVLYISEVDAVIPPLIDLETLTEAHVDLLTGRHPQRYRIGGFVEAEMNRTVSLLNSFTKH